MDCLVNLVGNDIVLTVRSASEKEHTFLINKDQDFVEINIVEDDNKNTDFMIDAKEARKLSESQKEKITEDFFKRIMENIEHVTSWGGYKTNTYGFYMDKYAFDVKQELKIKLENLGYVVNDILSSNNENHLQISW